MCKKDLNLIPFSELERILNLQIGHKEVVLEVLLDTANFPLDLSSNIKLSQMQKSGALLKRYFKDLLPVAVDIVRNTTVIKNFNCIVNSGNREIPIFSLYLERGSSTKKYIDISFNYNLGEWTDNDVDNIEAFGKIKELVNKMSTELNTYIEDYVLNKNKTPFKEIREFSLIYTPWQPIGCNDFVCRLDRAVSAQKNDMLFLSNSGILNSVKEFLDENLLEKYDLEPASTITVNIATDGVSYEIM